MHNCRPSTELSKFKQLKNLQLLLYDMLFEVYNIEAQIQNIQKVITWHD